MMVTSTRPLTSFCFAFFKTQLGREYRMWQAFGMTRMVHLCIIKSRFSRKLSPWQAIVWVFICTGLLAQSFRLPAAHVPNQKRPMSLWSTSGGPGSSQYNGPELTPILDTVTCPADLKHLNIKQLKQLSEELRWDTIRSVSKVGGHLGSSLGVVELTVALHFVFDAPEDRIVWDVAHQAYPHKILTGRRSRMSTLRQLHGLSGFTSRNESEYDCFGAGHSSTSISAALGMGVGKRLLGRKTNRCVAVIGDGALTAGMAYEAMNNAAYVGSQVLVVLNDNAQVSLPTGQPSAGGVVPAGALAGYTGRLLTSRAFQSVRDIAKGLNSFMPSDIRNLNKKVDEYVRGLATGGTLFEELGFYYVGPVDAHDLDTLVPILENLRDHAPEGKPVLLHVKSVKGKGYPPAEAAADRYHGVARFDVSTGVQHKAAQATASLTEVLAQALISLAERDRRVCAITAAMPGGTGIDKFGARFPRRTFDVGIAEQHAVTFAAGLAVEGLVPYVAIYSTFLQRAYDQLIHDVALQSLPVRFVLDRAGLVGNDGATHHGSFDLAYLSCVPNMVVMAPSDEVELRGMVETQYHLSAQPSALRFPRGSGYGKQALLDLYTPCAGADSLSLDEQRALSGQLGGPGQAGQLETNLRDVHAAFQASDSTVGGSVVGGQPLPVGKGRLVKLPRVGAKHRLCVLSVGTRLMEAVHAARQIEAINLDAGVTVADARFVRPLDEELLRCLASSHGALVTVEEGSRGGFGAQVLGVLSGGGLLDRGGLRVRAMTLPDCFIEQGPQKDQYDMAGLNRQHIAALLQELLHPMRHPPPRALIQPDFSATSAAADPSPSPSPYDQQVFPPAPFQ